MAKNTSILLGEYFEDFINEQLRTGRFSSVSEVVRTALRLFEQEETRKKTLVNELKLGEKSGLATRFSRRAYLKKIHSKHSD